MSPLGAVTGVRRGLLLLFGAAFVLTLLTIPSQASAAAFACNAGTGAPVTVRGDGLSELVSDAVITCTGGTPTTIGTAVPTVNLTLNMTTAITSRLLSANQSEAELTLDDPGPGSQLLCTTPTLGCNPVLGKGGPATYDGSAGHPNVFVGIVSGNQLTFFGVPIDQPGSGTLTLRIVNLRVNAAGLVAGGMVTGSASASPPANLPITNPTISFGTVLPRLSFSLLSSDGSTTVAAGPSVQACGTRSEVAIARVGELATGAFRTRTIAGAGPFNQDVPGVAYGSETGFSNSAFPSPFTSAGLADEGTRLELNFSGPAGTTITLPTSIGFSETAGSLRLAQSSTGAFVPTPGASAQLPLVGGKATATYEVVASDPTELESANIPVTLSAPRGTPAGVVTLTAELAPQSSVSTPSATAPIPRFSDKPTASTVATIVACPPTSPGGGSHPSIVSIRALSMTHKRFAVAPGLTAKSSKSAKTTRAPRGTAFLYTLSAPATVRIAIEQVVLVRRTKATHCLKSPRAQAKHCAIARPMLTLTRRDPAGSNKTPFTGRTSTRTLGPGSYTASVTATNAAGASKSQSVAFTVVPS